MKPLRETEGPLGRLLQAASSAPEDDAGSLVRMRARLAQVRSAPSPWALFLTATAVAVTAALVVGKVVPLLKTAPTRPAAPPALASWNWVDLEGKQIELPSNNEVTLGAGALAMQATRPVHLKTPRAEIETSSARFHLLIAASGATSLTVEEGSVVVRTRKETLSVPAGAAWASELLEPTDATSHHWALELERAGKPDDALVVLEGLTSRSTVWGELALYDAARICVSGGQADRARAFLATYQHRFPRGGVLQREVAALRQQLAP